MIDTTCPGLEMKTYLTGQGRKRVDVEEVLKNVAEKEPRTGRTWVYVSGPNAFIEGAKRSCKEAEVEFYGASWEI